MPKALAARGRKAAAVARSWHPASSSRATPSGMGSKTHRVRSWSSGALIAELTRPPEPYELPSRFDDALIDLDEFFRGPVPAVGGRALYSPLSQVSTHVWTRAHQFERVRDRLVVLGGDQQRCLPSKFGER